METKYPTLKRPRRKLCYFTEKESAPKQWGKVLTLEDVDKMFDDIDSCTPDLHPPSPLLQSSDTETNQSETISPAPLEKQSMEKLQEDQNILNNRGPDGDLLQPASSPSPKPVNDLDIPFKAHGPAKTSSPIEPNMDVVCVPVQDNEKHEVLSPILFHCEDEVAEEPSAAPAPTEKPCTNGEIPAASHGSELESPRCRVVLTKLSGLKEMAEAPCRNDNTESPVAEVRQEPELVASRTNVEAAERQPAPEVSSCVGRNMATFLEKLKLAVLSRPRRPRKSPVKTPPPAPEPEEDFFILDDTPFQFSIPRKNTSKKQKLSKTSSSEKVSSPDNKTNNRLQEELEKTSSKQDGGAVHQKMKKKKKKEKNHNVITSEYVNDDLANHIDPPAGDVLDEQKPDNKKKQLKKTPSKEKEQLEHQTEDVHEELAGKEQLSQKTEAKVGKSSERKTSKETKKSTKTIKANTPKETKEQEIRESDAGKEVTHVDAVEEQSQEQISEAPAETRDLKSPREKKTVKTHDADKEAKRKKHSAVSGGSSSKDTQQVLGKRKRKQTGQWWLSCPHSEEDPEEPEIQRPMVKKPKCSIEEPGTAVLTHSKAKKDKVQQKKKKQPVTSSTEPKSTEKKTKRSRKKNAKAAVSDEIKTDEILPVSEAEQEHIPDQDRDQSSPLVFAHRDHSLNSGGQIFQKVYHHSFSEKTSPRQPEEELKDTGRGKRGRKTPGNWWETNVSDGSRNISSQPNSKAPKPQKENNKQSKKRKSAGLRVPRNGDLAVPSKPAGGAPTPPAKLLSAPKTVKRSLATFKDIFTSGVETPTVVSDRGNRRNSGSLPAGEGPSKTYRKTDSYFFGGDDEDDAEHRSTQHILDTPPDEASQSNNTFKVLRSGPSSMIELEQHEDNDVLPSSRVTAALVASDFCGPPLVPLTLHPRDKFNLTEWFQNLWSTTSDEGVAISPDQFDWYSYQDRALGFQLDLNSSSFCSGKILLGSHMKKPLWVDHSARTVFNLSTSSVNVAVDGHMSRYRPGQTFMVECGQAYSIQNINTQPAVLYFTRMVAENSD